jgi:hypothetical protein
VVKALRQLPALHATARLSFQQHATAIGLKILKKKGARTAQNEKVKVVLQALEKDGTLSIRCISNTFKF